MKNRVLKRVTILATVLFALIFIGAYFPSSPAMQFFVVENSFIVPQQEVFTVLEIIELNGFTRDRIDNVQFAVLPEAGQVMITDQARIEYIWRFVSGVEVTTWGAEQVPINEELAIYLDFQFTNPNFNTGISMFGPVYILGRGPFAFVDNSSERDFIDLFARVAGIHVEVPIEIPTLPPLPPPPAPAPYMPLYIVTTSPSALTPSALVLP